MSTIVRKNRHDIRHVLTEWKSAWSGMDRAEKDRVIGWLVLALLFVLFTALVWYGMTAPVQPADNLDFWYMLP